MIFGTVTWMFDTFTSTDDFVQNNTVVLAKLDANHKEAMDNMELRYLDIIISLKERDLRELDELVDSGVTLDSEQQRRQNSLERAIEAHRQHRAELIGIPQGLD
jgi:mevalonate kinase